MESIGKPGQFHIKETHIEQTNTGELPAGVHGFDKPANMDSIWENPENAKVIAKNIKIESFVNHPDMNFSVLQEMFDEYVRRAGGESADLVGPERFVEVLPEAASNDTVGKYYHGVRLIGFTANTPLLSEKTVIAPSYSKGVKGFILDQKDIINIETLLTTLHEEWHAVAGHYNFEKDSRLEKSRERHGFKDKIEYKLINKESVSGLRLDEGFVQMMAERMLPEYVHRIGTFHGLNEKDAETYLDAYSSDFNTKFFYPLETYMVKLFVVALANLLEVGEDKIEEALLRSYLRGTDVFYAELENKFAEAGFQVEYKKISKMMKEPFLNGKDNEKEWKKRYREIIKSLHTVIPNLQNHAVYINESHTNTKSIIASEEER